MTGVDINNPDKVDNPFFKSLCKVESTYDDSDETSPDDNANADKALVCGAIITLCKILDNIILEKKYNAKTRSIKLSNKLFKDKVGKVSGGVDFLMACKFTFNTVQSEKGHSIQLKRQHEDRNVLIIARKYLDEYGQKVLKLQVGKLRNELPPFIIKDQIDTEALLDIQNNVNSLFQEKFRSLENEISSIIADDSLDFGTKDINVSNDGKYPHNKDFSPATPETLKSEGIERDGIPKDENGNLPGDMPSPSSSNELATPNESDEISHNSDRVEGNTQKSEGRIDVDTIEVHQSGDNSTVLDEVIKNKSFTPIHELTHDPIPDDCAKDIGDLSGKEKTSLDKISKISIRGVEENEAILSIIDGRVPDHAEKESRSYGLMKKLKNIATRRNRVEKDEEDKRNNDMEERSVVSHATHSDIRIKDTEVLRLNFNVTKPSTSDESSEIILSENDYKYDIDSIKIGCDIIKEDEDAIKVGLGLFFVVLVKIFKEPISNAELSVSTPLEIIYRLWGAILRSELELNGVKTNHIFEAFRKVLVAIGENDDIKNIVTLSGDELKICNFICNTLVREGFIVSQVVEEENMKEGSNEIFSYQSISANNVSHLYGERIALTHYSDLIDKISKWHDIVVRGCNETLGSVSSSDEAIINVSSSDALSLWYAGRLLPYHITATGRHKEAMSLLLDKHFVTHRFNTCGHLLGTLRHLKDAELIIFRMKESNNKESDELNDVDFGESVIEAIHDIIQGMLEQRKKEIDIAIKNSTVKYDINQSTTQSAHDVGCALHHLGISMGKSKRYHKEIDIYSEALRLKTVSKCSKSLVGETLLSMSICYRNLGDLWSALSRCKELLLMETMVHGDNHINVSKVLHHQGIILSELGEFDDSLVCFQKSLQTMKEINTSSNEGVVKTLCWIGKVNRDRGDFLKALDSFQTAKSSIRMILEEDNLELAEIYQNIGVIYDDMDKYNESLHYLYECLRIRRTKLGDDRHADVCETLCSIATVFKKKDLDKSLTLFRLVLNIKSKQLSLGKVCESRELLIAHTDVLEVVKEKLQHERKNKSLHEEIATLFLNIGSIHESLHEYNDAVSYYNKSLKIRKIRKDYNEIGNILNSLGIAHAKRKSFKKASRCFSDSLAIRKTILGDRHTEVAEILHNLGNCAAKQDDFDSAAIHYEQSLIIKKLKYGDSESTAKTIHTIGLVNEKLGLLDDAFKYYEDALRIRMDRLDANHLDVAFSLHSVGTIHRKKNELDKAHDYFTRSLFIKKQHYVVNHLSVAETMHELAITLSESGKVDEAISNYESALQIYEKSLGAHKITVTILDSLGSLHLSLMKLDVSYRYLERALVLKRMLFGGESEIVSDTLYLIGKVQGKSGDLDDALESLKEALRIRKEYHSDESLPVAAVINDVGVLQLRKGQHNIARTCFSESMRVWKLKLDKDHDYHSESLMNLAEVDYLSGEYDDAIEKLTEALALIKANHGDRHLSVALIYFKLGLSLKIKKAHVEALDAFDRALLIRSAEYGDRSISVAEVLKNIGTLCLDMGEFAKARNYLGEALNIMSMKHSNDIETADTMYNLGKVMMKMKYTQEAQTYFEEALEIRNRRIITDDSIAAEIITDIATIFEEKQQFNDSLLMHKKALKIRKSVFGEHESVGDSYHMMGNIEQATDQHEDALKSFGSALVVYQTVLGDDHLSCAKTMNNIALIYEAMNECNEALKYHREALRIRKKNLGKDHLKVANSLDNIAGVYQKQNNVDKASSALKEALRIRITRLGNDHLEVATTLFGMGIVYCDKGDLQRAMDCYEASLNIRKRKMGSSSIEVAQTLHNIGSLYAMKQDYNEALIHWKSALEKYRMTLGDDHHMVACAIGNIQMAENVLADESDHH